MYCSYLPLVLTFLCGEFSVESKAQIINRMSESTSALGTPENAFRLPKKDFSGDTRKPRASIKTPPTLDDVLIDRACPCRKEDFEAFLHIEHSAENLHFLDHVREYVARYDIRKELSRDQESSRHLTTQQESQEEGLSQQFSLTSNRSNWKLESNMDVANQIIGRFVLEGATEQVNLPENIVRDILDREERSKDMFDAAYAEIERLINRDPFPRFIRKVKSENIGGKEVLRRYLYGTVFILLGILILVLLTLYTHPLARIAIFPLWWVGMVFLLQGKFRICNYSAHLGVRMHHKDISVADPITQPRAERHIIQYQEINKALVFRTYVFYLVGVIGSSVLVVLTLLIPPSSLV